MIKEIISPRIEIRSAVFASSGSTVSFRSSSKNGRYLIDLEDAPLKGEKLALAFSGPIGAGEIAVKVTPGRTLRKRGWERIEVKTWVTKSENQDLGYSAYQLLKEAPSGGNNHFIIIFSNSDTANFMSFIPDDTPLGKLTLPGTHQSCALYGFPISQCQQPSTPIGQQLLDGVRFLDVRLRVVDDQLLIYHGPFSQQSSLPVLLDALQFFLSSHPTETIILCLKEESPPFHASFSALVYAAFKNRLERFWFLEERIPKLGEVRGKGMLMTRFNRDKDTENQWPDGMGIHPSRWPDSRIGGFDWNCGGTQVRTQDWYRVKTFLEIPKKFQVIVRYLEPTLQPSPTYSPPFTLCYTTASYFPLSLPTIIAKGFGWPNWGLGIEGINARMCRVLLEWMADGKRVRGCVPMDFYRQCAGKEGLAALLVQMNFMEW
ncbi:hypothetical protein AYX15_06480 [Cryptococcus neoformans]|nr:hypothetical protein AYX15_06480 [Cryptococcus neoformans var. grubii]